MCKKIFIVIIKIEHWKSNVTGMIKNNERFNTADQHIATNVEFFPIN